MPGDTIYVTGKLGAAMLGYEALRDGAGEDSTAYRRPMARLPEGQALAPVVSAIMDISDGLLLDAWRMGRASDVTMAIDSGAVPIAAPEDRRMDALRWGDDYELLFTAPANAAIPVKAARIGTVLEKGDEPLLLDGAVPRGRLGFEHS
jgi:thiamine-monophosphate kinase